MNKNYIPAIVMVLLLLVAVVSVVLINRPKISDYNGDGKISIVEAPPLGRTGVRVDFQEFIFDDSYTETLNLAGLPFDFDNPPYDLYLVIPQRYTWERKIKGDCAVELLADGKVIDSAKAKIEDMRRTGVFEETLFYFEDFRIPSGHNDLFLKVEASGVNPSGVKTAFFRLQFGGSK